MKGTFKKDSTEFQMFGDFYNIVKEFWIPEKTVEYNDAVTHKINDFTKKYGVTSTSKKQKDHVSVMAQKLAIAMIDYVDDARIGL